MIKERMEEFIVMLLLERLAIDREDVADFLKSNYNIDAFNNRYKELIDEFLEPYALNNTEKSEEND